MESVINNPLRNLRRFRAEPIPFMTEVRERHGDLVPLRIGPKRFYFAYHPRHAQRVLSDHLGNYPKSRFVFDRIRPVTGKQGLVQLEGEAWNRERQLTAPTMKPEALQSYLQPIHQCTSDLLAELRDGETRDFAEVMTSLILRTAGLIFLDVDLKATAPDLGSAFLEANRYCGHAFRSLLPLPAFFPSPRRRKLAAAQKRIARFFEDLPASDTGLKLVHRLHGRTPHALDHMRTFLFAGHETTAASLSWTLALLADRPDVQEQLAAEAKNADLSTINGVRALRYIRAVYQEALRLYPPAWILAREVREDDEIDGVKIRAGSQLLLSLRELHRHPDFWKEPHRFQPERFLNGSPEPYSFLPFGAGPRICSGTQLALVEAVVVLARLFQELRFTTTQKELTAEAMITLHPKEGVCLHIHKAARTYSPLTVP